MQQSQHTTHVALPFEETCRRVSQRAEAIMTGASRSAVRHIERAAKKESLGGFDPTERVKILVVELERVTNDFARMPLHWQAGSDDRRLLPHVEAQLLIHAVIPKGPNASTAISVVGRFTPSRGLRRQVKDLLFGRRIVDEALGRFLESAAALIVDESAPAAVPNK